jgi:hypothetical protein
VVTASFSLVYAEHFQQGVVLLGSVPDHVYCFDLPPRQIALREIDQTRAFRTEDVHPKTQRFRLSIIVHG